MTTTAAHMVAHTKMVTPAFPPPDARFGEPMDMDV